jgi:hypothetical protein
MVPQCDLRLLFKLSLSLSLSLSRLPEIILCVGKIYDLHRRLSSFNTVEFYSHNSKGGVELLFWCNINNSLSILTIKRVVKRHIFIQTVAFSWNTASVTRYSKLLTLQTRIVMTFSCKLRREKPWLTKNLTACEEWLCFFELRFL